jgi:hypothetical protein
MVLELVLHATEEVLSDEIIAVDSTCALEVVGNITVGSIGVDDFLSLVIAGHNDSNHKTTDQNAC